MCTDIFHNSTCQTCDTVMHYGRLPLRRDLYDRVIRGWACLGINVRRNDVTGLEQCDACTRKAEQEEKEYYSVLRKYVADEMEELPSGFGEKFLGELKDHKDPLEEEREANMTELQKKLATLETHSDTSGKAINTTPATTHGHSMASRAKSRDAQLIVAEGSRPGSAPPTAPNYPPDMLPYHPRQHTPRPHPERDPLLWYPPSETGSNKESEKDERTEEQLMADAEKMVAEARRQEREVELRKLLYGNDSPIERSGSCPPDDRRRQELVRDFPTHIQLPSPTAISVPDLDNVSIDVDIEDFKKGI